MNAFFPSEDTAKNAVRVWSLIKDLKVAMMTTASAGTEQAKDVMDGFDTRPMRALFEEHADALWFIVPRDLPLFQAHSAEGRPTLLTFSNGPDGDHVAIQGSAGPVDDRVKLKALWNAHADIAFPKGSTDPNATLLKFEPAKATFWAGGSDILSFVVNFLEAKLTGKPPVVGEHAVVEPAAA